MRPWLRIIFMAALAITVLLMFRGCFNKNGEIPSDPSNQKEPGRVTILPPKTGTAQKEIQQNRQSIKKNSVSKETNSGSPARKPHDIAEKNSERRATTMPDSNKNRLPRKETSRKNDGETAQNKVTVRAEDKSHELNNQNNERHTHEPENENFSAPGIWPGPGNLQSSDVQGDEKQPELGKALQDNTATDESRDPGQSILFSDDKTGSPESLGTSRQNSWQNKEAAYKKSSLQENEIPEKHRGYAMPPITLPPLR